MDDSHGLHSERWNCRRGCSNLLEVISIEDQERGRWMRFMRELAFHGVEFLNIWADDRYIEDFIPIDSFTLASLTSNLILSHLIHPPNQPQHFPASPRKKVKKQNSPPTRIPNNPRLSYNKITKPPVKVIHQTCTLLVLDNIFHRYKSSKNCDTG
jgi:hypothetical protein